MIICAGAPCSICLACAEMAAYEIVAFLPVPFCHWALTASSAFLRLAAANTTTSVPSARAGAPARLQASTTAPHRAVIPPSHLRLLMIKMSILLAPRAAPRRIATTQDHRPTLYSSEYCAALERRQCHSSGDGPSRHVVAGLGA